MKLRRTKLRTPYGRDVITNRSETAFWYALSFRCKAKTEPGTHFVEFPWDNEHGFSVISKKSLDEVARNG